MLYKKTDSNESLRIFIYIYFYNRKINFRAGRYFIIIFQNIFFSWEQTIHIYYRDVEGGRALWRHLPALIFLTENKVTVAHWKDVLSSLPKQWKWNQVAHNSTMLLSMGRAGKYWGQARVFLFWYWKTSQSNFRLPLEALLSLALTYF